MDIDKVIGSYLLFYLLIKTLYKYENNNSRWKRF